MRSDNGTEFKNTQVEEFLDDEAIKHEFSTPYTPQQNGVVERKNRTLIDMARTMLDEYKTSDIFWCEAINTACRAINRLYLHKKLKKTSYELLTGNKPKVSYFRVFGCKCFILNKRTKTSKFAPKVDEGILLGYGSNEHAYRIYYKTSGRVEVAVDVTFDESNGSQVEHLDESVVGKKDPPCDAIKHLATGEIRPQEDKETRKEDLQDDVAMSSADTLDADVQGTPTVNQQGGSTTQQGGSAAPPSAATEATHVQGRDLTPILESEVDAEVEDDQEEVEHPRLRQTIQRDQPADNILGSLRKGVLTRSHLANFCQHFSFVSSIEPDKIEKALADEDWVLAMQEELNNFGRNQVWTLVERPNTNVIGTKWVFRNKQDENGVVTRNKADWWLKDIHKLKEWTLMRHLHQWQGLKLYECFWPLLPTITLSCIKWMSKVHFLMVPYKN